MKTCPNCKTEKETTEFYNRRNKEGNSPYCKTCTKIQALKRIREFKIKCIEYKGGKCISCDYKTYAGALEFHHLDSEEKEFEISNRKNYNFEPVKKELDKCILFCANCHREIHAGLIKYENGLIVKSTPEELEWNLSVSDKHLKIKKDLELIIKRYKNKETTKNISFDYDVTPSYLLMILNEMNIKITDIPEQHDVIHPKKGNYPSDEELSKLVWLKPSQQLAKEFGVSDVALAKHCKKRGIEKPTRGYWASLKV